MVIEENKIKKVVKCLSLTPVDEKEGLFMGIKSDGKTYTVRKDRHRIFFPGEWKKFIMAVKENRKIIFESLLQTGARIDEVLHIRPKDFDFERNNLTLYVTKAKASKGQSKLMGGNKRSFQVSSQFIKKIKKYIRENKIKDGEFIFKMSKQGVSQLFKRTLKSVGLNEWEFSLHNIRKTSGMWLKTVQRRGIDLDVSEICMRLGHDHNTFLKHYGSPSIYNDRDRDMIIEIMGDVYKLR